MSQESTEIRDARIAEGALQIDWGDGHHTAIPLSRLRAKCPCATCREVRDAPPDPFRVLTASEAAAVPDLVTSSRWAGTGSNRSGWTGTIPASTPTRTSALSAHARSVGRIGLPDAC